MLFMQNWHFTSWRRSFYLACILYGISWLFGIMMTLRFASQQMVQGLLIDPGQTHDAWYYISHNVGVEGVLLLGACTFGIGTGLVLCFNGLLSGMLASAIARHYGLGVVLAGLLPHGVFEVCAWILISTCGFLLSGRFKRLISSLWSNKTRTTAQDTLQVTSETPFETHTGHSINRTRDVSFVLIIAATLLLVLAGIIEAYVSPMLILRVI